MIFEVTNLRNFETDTLTTAKQVHEKTCLSINKIKTMPLGTVTIFNGFHIEARHPQTQKELL